MAESNQEVGGRVGRSCQPCLNRDITRQADVFCSTCKEFQCNDCTNVHTIYAFMKNHKLLSVGECPSNIDAKDSYNADMNGLDICKTHNKRFKFHCEDDKALACSMCVFEDHRKCNNVVQIEKLSKDNQCETLMEKLQTAITTTNQTVENLKEAESCLSDDVQSVPDKLSKIRTNIIQRFDEFAERVTEDANSYREKTTADWTKSKLECATKIKTMKSSFKHIDNIVTKGTKSQQFIIARRMTEIVHNEVKNANSLCTDLRTLNVTCKFDEHLDTFRSNLLATIEPEKLEMQYNMPKKTYIKVIASIDLKQTGDDVEEPCYSGLDFLPDGRLVVVDNKNAKFLIYDNNLSLKSTYNLPYQHPLCLVVVSDEEVAITSAGECRLDFLHINASNEITLNRTFEVNAMYKSISMMDDENFVVSTIDHDTPVRIVSVSGEEKDFDIVFLSKKYPTDTSFTTYIRGEDKVVLTDKDENSIYIYDIKTGEKVVIKDELIEKPCGVAVGSYDHVFVGSDSTNSITEVTLAGRVVASYQVDMNFPRYLAVFKGKQLLAVSNSELGSIQLKLYQIVSE